MSKSIGTRIKLLLSSYPSLYLIDPFILIQTPLLKKLPILDAVVLSVTCEQKKYIYILRWITNYINQ